MQRNDWKIFLGLVFAALLAYSPALELGWIWDDDQYVFQNDTLHSWEGLQAIWLRPGATPQYYPLVFSAFWLIHQAWGDNPLPYHALNVLLHAFNAMLCFQILRQLSLKHAGWIALAFALHPVQVESVAWVTELKNVLSASMYGLAWLALYPVLLRLGTSGDSSVVSSQNAPKGSPHLRWLPISLGIGCFVAALLSKSVTASLPAAMLVAIWFQTGKLKRRQLLAATPLLLIGALFGWNTARLEVAFVGAQGSDFEHGWLARVGIAARCIVHYTTQAVAPLEQIFFYPRYDPNDWQAASIALGLVATGLVASWLLAVRRGRRGPLAGLLFFAGSAFPALGFLNVYPHRYSFVADHFVYIPIVGLLSLVVSGLIELGCWLRQRFAASSSSVISYALVGAWSLLLALGTVRHIPNFADEITLWEDTLRKNPSCAIAMHNLAMRYNTDGRLAEALPLIERAVEFELDRFQMLNTLGVIHSSLGNRAAAADAFRRSIELFPDNPLAVHNLGKVLQEEAIGDPLSPEARQTLERAHALYIKSHAAQPKFDHALGAGVTAADLQRFDDASRWLETALAQRPGDIPATLELARVKLGTGDHNQARRLALQVLAVFPESQPADDLRRQAEERLSEAGEQ